MIATDLLFFNYLSACSILRSTTVLVTNFSWSGFFLKLGHQWHSLHSHVQWEPTLSVRKNFQSQLSWLQPSAFGFLRAVADSKRGTSLQSCCCTECPTCCSQRPLQWFSSPLTCLNCQHLTNSYSSYSCFSFLTSHWRGFLLISRLLSVPYLKVE